jgi:hypothetical protein
VPLLFLALVAAVAGRAGGQEKADRMEDAAARLAELRKRELALIVQRFDQYVFRRDQGAAGARKRLEQLLASQVDVIDRACKLTEAQRNKLELAGQGDINRFFARYEATKQKAEMLEPDGDKLREFRQEMTELGSTLELGLFHENSLLYKSLRNTLTVEQYARYEPRVRQRLVERHRQAAERAVMLLEQRVAFRDGERRRLLTFLIEETNLSPRPSSYDPYLLLVQLSRKPAEKLEALLDEAERDALKHTVNQIPKLLELQLRNLGLWPDEEGKANPHRKE